MTRIAILVASLVMSNTMVASALEPPKAPRVGLRAENAIYVGCDSCADSPKVFFKVALEAAAKLDPRTNLLHNVAIIGNDDRVPVGSKRNTHPYSSVAHFRASNGNQCTASLVANRVLMLASHCFYGKPNFWGGDRAISGSVTFPNGETREVCLEYDSNSPKIRSLDSRTMRGNDLALVRFNGPLVPGVKLIYRSETNAKDLERLFDLKNRHGIKANAATVPQYVFTGGRVEFKEQIYDGTVDSCRVHQALNSNIALHTCDNRPGQSGAPLIVFEWDSAMKKHVPVIYGLITSEYTPAALTYNKDTANELISIAPHNDAIDRVVKAVDGISSRPCVEPN